MVKCATKYTLFLFWVGGMGVVMLMKVCTFERDIKFKCQLHVEMTNVRLAADKKKTEWPNKILSDIFSENVVLEYLCRRNIFISKGHKCLLGVVKKNPHCTYLDYVVFETVCHFLVCVCMGGRGEGVVILGPLYALVWFPKYVV